MRAAEYIINKFQFTLEQRKSLGSSDLVVMHGINSNGPCTTLASKCWLNEMAIKCDCDD